MKKLYLLVHHNYFNKYFCTLAVICTLLLAGNIANAQLSLTNGSPTVFIDFSNTMPTTAGTTPSTAFTAAGFSPNPTNATPGRLNSNAWAFTGWSDGSVSYGGTQTTAATDFTRGVTAVAVTQGGIYAYQGAPNSAANPALMMQPGGSDFTPGTMTLKLQNNGTSIINQLAVSYKIYQRNDQARSQSFNLSYSYDDVTYTAFSPYDYATPTTADGAGWVVGATMTGTPITGLNIPATTFIYLRWSSDDVSGSGSRDEIGIDDINITANYPGACTPPTINASVSSFSSILANQMTVNFTRGNGTGGMLAVVSPAALVSNPVSGISYTANSNYGTGAAVSNGYVVYNSNAGSGSFTVTGLTAGVTYNINLFEYNVSGPCYVVAGALATQATAGSSATPANQQFRSNGTTGNWANAFTWDYFNGISWVAADRIPTAADQAITIQATHTVDISCPSSMDQLVIAGTLTVSNSAVMNLGTGLAIDIQSGGILKFQTSGNYTTTFLNPSAATLNVATGGKITIGNGGSTSGYSPLGHAVGLVTWNDASIFEWNTTDPFITNSVTYFPGAAAGVIPIFRVSKSPSLQPGAATNTAWNGLMEVNANLTLKLAGTKTFRNGITGTAALTQDDACGQFIINGATAKLGVATLNLNTTTALGLDINTASTTMMTANVIVNSAGTGVFSVSGSSSLYCDAFIMSGTGIFTLNSACTMRLGDPGGISSAGATGNIQTSGLRTFNSNTSFTYDGTASQITGNGMPTSIATLTINNSGGAGNKTVTLTTTNTTATTLNLSLGLFAAGAGQQLNIATGGTVNATSGDFATGNTAGIINFPGSGSFTGTSNPYDVYASGAVNFGAGTVTIQNAGSFRINAGGSASVNAPFYGTGSSLVYNTGGGYNVGTEWATPAVTGRGVPYHVTILAPSTAVTFNLAASARTMLGNLTISSNSSFALSTAVGGDLLIGGNWTRAATGTFTNNARQVNFNGAAADQTITVTGGGTETFGYIAISKPVGFPNLILAGAPNATNITLNGNPASGAPTNTLVLTSSSNLDLNQNTFNFTSWNGNQNNIQVDGNTATGGTLTRNISSTGGQGVFAVFNSNPATHNITISRVSISATRRAVLIFGSTVKITTGAVVGGSGGIDFGNLPGPAAISTVNGILQIDPRGFVTGNAPTYGTGSILIYNTGGTFDRNVEWGAVVNPGYPYNVTIQANTTLQLNFPNVNGNADRAIAGTLNITAGSTCLLSTTAANKLTIGGSLQLDGTLILPTVVGGDLYLAGDWTRSSTGVFTPNDRAVFFNGTASTITASGGQLFPYLYLTMAAAGNSVLLSDDISISKEFGITQGVFNLQNKNVTLKSDATATASMGKFGANGSVSYNGGTGTGRFIVERYIPTAVGSAPNHLKTWQFLAVPVNKALDATGQTIYDGWQESGTTPTGYGTIVTSNVAGAGFDVVGGTGPSMKTYTPASSSWTGVPNTTSTELYNQKGYMLFVRGDRNVTTSGGAPTVTTLRSKGKIMEPGNLPPVITVGANQFESVGNPYASAIDFSNTAGVVKGADVNNIFYVWDPRGGGIFGYGAYKTCTKNIADANYTINPGGGSYGASGSIQNIIQSGQAFFVSAGPGPLRTISFNENAKTSGSSLVARPGNPPATPVKQLRNSLYNVIGGERILVDGVLDEFDRTLSNNVDRLDAIKLMNAGENLGIRRAEKIMAVERRDNIQRRDTILYYIDHLNPGQYEFEFEPKNIPAEGLRGFLEDKWLGTRTPVSMRENTIINFTITGVAASRASDRFMLLFGDRKKLLMYSLLKIEKQEDAVLLNWKTAANNDGSYEVERSADGINFTKIHVEYANANEAYSWKDIDPLPGSSYYRIHNLDKENASYSNLVKLPVAEESTAVTVYPNPVRDGLLGLHFNKLAKGNYVLKLINNNGQVVWTNNLAYDGVAVNKQFRLPATLASGVYKMEILQEELDDIYIKLIVD